MMDEDIIKRLEHMILPDIRPADHRSELRASLLKEYSSLRVEDERYGMWFKLWLTVIGRNKRLNRRVLMVSVPLVVILLILLSLQISGIFFTSSSVIAKAYTAIESLESFRILDDVFVQQVKTDELVYTYRKELMYIDPDSYHYTIKRMDEIYNWWNYPKEVIIIGDHLYTRQYHAFSDIIESFNEMTPTKENTLEILDALTEIKKLPDEIIDNTDCLHYKGIVDVEKWLDYIRPSIIRTYESIIDEFPSWYQDIDEFIESVEERIRSQEQSYEFWFGKDDYLIRQWNSVIKTLPDTPPTGDPYKISSVAKYYDFNKEIIIEPPLTESGELEEGWHELSMENFGGLR
jgi:hypothetical protein